MKAKAKTLSDQDKLALRNKAKVELHRLENIDMNLVDQFKRNFELCEITYKVILEDYYKAQGKENDQLKLHSQQAVAALNRAGYDFDKDLITRLFGSENKVGKRSIKKLRDDLTHAVSSSALNELENRQNELFRDINSFLKKIKEFDDVKTEK